MAPSARPALKLAPECVKRVRIIAASGDRKSAPLRLELKFGGCDLSSCKATLGMLCSYLLDPSNPPQQAKAAWAQVFGSTNGQLWAARKQGAKGDRTEKPPNSLPCWADFRATGLGDDGLAQLLECLSQLGVSLERFWLCSVGISPKSDGVLQNFLRGTASSALQELHLAGNSLDDGSVFGLLTELAGARRLDTVDAKAKPASGPCWVILSGNQVNDPAVVLERLRRGGFVVFLDEHEQQDSQACELLLPHFLTQSASYSRDKLGTKRAGCSPEYLLEAIASLTEKADKAIAEEIPSQFNSNQGSDPSLQIAESSRMDLAGTTTQKHNTFVDAAVVSAFTTGGVGASPNMNAVHTASVAVATGLPDHSVFSEHCVNASAGNLSIHEQQSKLPRDVAKEIEAAIEAANEAASWAHEQPRAAIEAANEASIEAAKDRSSIRELQPKQQGVVISSTATDNIDQSAAIALQYRDQIAGTRIHSQEPSGAQAHHEQPILQQEVFNQNVFKQAESQALTRMPQQHGDITCGIVDTGGRHQLQPQQQLEIKKPHANTIHGHQTTTPALEQHGQFAGMELQSSAGSLLTNSQRGSLQQNVGVTAGHGATSHPQTEISTSGSFHAGELIEYFSQTKQKWIDAIVMQRCPCPYELYDLNIKRQVLPSSIRRKSQPGSSSGPQLNVASWPSALPGHHVVPQASPKEGELQANHEVSHKLQGSPEGFTVTVPAEPTARTMDPRRLAAYEAALLSPMQKSSGPETLEEESGLEPAPWKAQRRRVRRRVDESEA